MRHLMSGALAAVALFAIGCGGQVSDPTVTTTSLGQTLTAPAASTAAQDGSALVRFVNADPDAGGLDIVMDEDSLFSDVEYLQTTPYMEVPVAAMERFELRDTGTDDTLWVNHRALLLGRHYTLVALPRARYDTRLAVMSDNLYLLEPDQARVRVVNATIDVDELDLHAAATGERLLHGIDPATGTSFVDVDMGVLEIHLADGRMLPPLSNLEVRTGRVYTFVVAGQAGDLDLIRIQDRIDG